jgi:hypothetical protein
LACGHGPARFGHPPVESTGDSVDAELPDPLMTTDQIVARSDEI